MYKCLVNNNMRWLACCVFPLGPLSSKSGRVQSVVDQALAPSSLASFSARLKVGWDGISSIKPTVVWRVLVLTHFILASNSPVTNFKGKVVRHDVVGQNTLVVGCSVAIGVNLTEMLELSLVVHQSKSVLPQICTLEPLTKQLTVSAMMVECEVWFGILRFGRKAWW